MPSGDIEVADLASAVAADASSVALREPPRAPDTVFSVLATQARRRTIGELRTTALGCAVNAGLLVWQHPALGWLASAFVAGSAYGAWGLFDQALTREMNKETVHPGSVTFLRGLRGFSAGVGVSAAVWTLFKFMAAALGGWQH